MCFHHAGLCQEGAEVASAVQGDSDIATLWEELADAPDALPEKVSFEDFLMVDSGVAVTASPLDSETVTDGMTSGSGANDKPLPEDDCRCPMCSGDTAPNYREVNWSSLKLCCAWRMRFSLMVLNAVFR